MAVELVIAEQPDSVKPELPGDSGGVGLRLQLELLDVPVAGLDAETGESDHHRKADGEDDGHASALGAHGGANVRDHSLAPPVTIHWPPDKPAVVNTALGDVVNGE